MKIGDKVKVVKDIPSINGMLHKNTIVKVDEIKENDIFRVVDTLGKIWWVSINNITEDNSNG